MENQNKQEVKNNSIVSEFVPYEESLELKELGFDEPCISFYPQEDKIGFNGKYHSIKEGYKNSTVNDIWIKKYNKDFKCVAAPTYSQAFRWFREKYKLHYPIAMSDGVWFYDKWSLGGYKTYEEAELACLRKLIEIVKKK